MLEDWSDESLYWYVMALRWMKVNAAQTIAQITAIAPAPLRRVIGVVLGRQLGRTPAVQGLGRLPYDDLVRETGLRLDDLVLLLGGSPFFRADRPSAADLAIYGQLQLGLSGPTPEFAELVSDRPALADFMKRVEDASRA